MIFKLIKAILVGGIATMLISCGASTSPQLTANERELIVYSPVASKQVRFAGEGKPIVDYGSKPFIIAGPQIEVTSIYVNDREKTVFKGRAKRMAVSQTPITISTHKKSKALTEKHYSQITIPAGKAPVYVRFTEEYTGPVTYPYGITPYGYGRMRTQDRRTRIKIVHESIYKKETR